MISKSWSRDSKMQKRRFIEKFLESWVQRVVDFEMLKKMKVKRHLMDTIRERQWRFVGRILREANRALHSGD